MAYSPFPPSKTPTSSPVPTPISTNKGPQKAFQTPKKNTSNAITYSGIRISKDSEKSILSFCLAVLKRKQDCQDIYNKMDQIDIAYARYTEATNQIAADATNGISSGVDNRRAIENGGVCCGAMESSSVTPPIVISQVDAYVAYLADIFLSGIPLFPVVSSPAKRIWAEQLEALLDDHAQIGGYARQLLLFIRDGAKYNFSGIEVDWTEIPDPKLIDAITTGQKVQKNTKKFNKIKRLNPRNIVWDWSVPAGDVALEGDFIGYVELLSRMKFKKLCDRLKDKNISYNYYEALSKPSTVAGSITSTGNFRDDPQISNYINKSRSQRGDTNWDSWFDPGKKGSAGRLPVGSMWEVFKLYARIIPSDHGIAAPAPNSPQIWCFYVSNNNTLIGCERVITAYDILPILCGQPLEDGLSYQTQSIAEGEVAFQEAAKTLFDIRFAAARRAVSDRALYIPDMIKPSDINNPTAAPKIPVNISQLSPKKIGDAYAQIPFDMRGTESTIQDAQTIVAFSNQLHGVNGPRQGNFQKGNKSVQEWTDTMGGSDGRMRIPALILEHQVFSPMKSLLTFNIFLYGPEQVTVNSQKTGSTLNINIDQLRRQNLSFRVCDGYSPKSKVASTEVIMGGMNLIMNSPVLQQAYASSLPSMFAQFMSLSGVKGFEEFDPNYLAQQQALETQNGAPGNLPVNQINTNVATSGAPPAAQPIQGVQGSPVSPIPGASPAAPVNLTVP